MENTAIHTSSTETGPIPVSAQQQFLTFRLGEEEYGIDIMHVMEIRGWIPATRLPNVSEFILGVINLRGVVVPILDMRLRFHMGPAVLTPQSVIIILYANDCTIGILVDSVSDILDVEAQDIKAAPSMSRSIDEAFIAGLVSLDERMVVVLNSDKIFNAHDTALPLQEEKK